MKGHKFRTKEKSRKSSDTVGNSSRKEQVGSISETGRTYVGLSDLKTEGQNKKSPLEAINK